MAIRAPVGANNVWIYDRYHIMSELFCQQFLLINNLRGSLLVFCLLRQNMQLDLLSVCFGILIQLLHLFHQLYQLCWRKLENQATVATMLCDERSCKKVWYIYNSNIFQICIQQFQIEAMKNWMQLINHQDSHLQRHQNNVDLTCVGCSRQHWKCLEEPDIRLGMFLE